MFLGSSASAKVNYYEPTYSTDPWADIDSYDWLFQMSNLTNNLDILYYLQPSGTSGYLTPDGNLTLFAIYKGGASDSEKYDLIVLNDLATRTYNLTSKRRSNGNYFNGNTSNISVFTIDYLKERLNNNIYDTSCKNVGPLVFNPKYCKIFASQEDYKEYILNFYGNDPDAPSVDLSDNAKVTYPSGDYCYINTLNGNLIGCINKDPGKTFLNFEGDRELELYELFYNEDFSLISDYEYNATVYWYDKNDNYSGKQTVTVKRLNTNSTYEYLGNYLSTNDTLVEPSLVVHQNCTYENFKFVAPSHIKLFRYLNQELDPGDIDWPLNPFPDDPYIPDDPEPISIPSEWGFLGQLFDSFVGGANTLLSNISSKISGFSNSVGNALSNLTSKLINSFNDTKDTIFGFMNLFQNSITDFKTGVSDYISDLKTKIISSINNFKNSVLTAIVGLASDIGDSVSVGFSDVLIELLVPSENYFSDKFTALRQNFTFIDSIVNSGQIIIDRLKNISGNTSPTITIDLSNKISGASYGSQIVVINFDWYTPYKKSVDILISSIIWVSYIFLLYKRAPEIIRGSGMITSIFGGSNLVN